MALHGVCLDCKQQHKIHGRGLCQGCYNRMKKGGTLDKLYPMVGRNPHDHGVTRGKKQVEVSPDKSAAIAAAKSNSKLNPLLNIPAPAPRQIILDLFHRHDLYNWLQDQGVTPENIIELLEARKANMLRLAA